MSESMKYAGGCHCGAVRYEVVTELAGAVAYSCSFCMKIGWMLVFAPATQFTLHSGEDTFADYQFNKKVLHHQFCQTCGVHSFSRGKSWSGEETVAINPRCLEGVNLALMEPKTFDGKSL